MARSADGTVEGETLKRNPLRMDVAVVSAVKDQDKNRLFSGSSINRLLVYRQSTRNHSAGALVQPTESLG